MGCRKQPYTDSDKSRTFRSNSKFNQTEATNNCDILPYARLNRFSLNAF